jgi:hypothetical protein
MVPDPFRDMHVLANALSNRTMTSKPFDRKPFVRKELVHCRAQIIRRRDDSREHIELHCRNLIYAPPHAASIEIPHDSPTPVSTHSHTERTHLTTDRQVSTLRASANDGQLPSGG